MLPKPRKARWMYVYDLIYKLKGKALSTSIAEEDLTDDQNTDDTKQTDYW